MSPLPDPHPAAARGLVARLRWAGMAACVVVLVVATAGLAGGLEEVPPPPPPTIAVDEVFPGEPWNVAVAGAVLAAELGPVRLRDEANHWLVVVADIEVTADESRHDLSDVLYVMSTPDLVRHEPGAAPVPVRADEIRVVRDTTRAVSLHPGLTERLLYVWERAGDAPPPTELEVWIVGKTRRQSSLTGRMEWLDAEPRARVVVPVRDRRDEW